MTTTPLQEDPKLKKRLAYIPDRGGCAGIVNEDEFSELVRNYVLNLKVADELKDDIIRVFTYILIKNFYNKYTDSISLMAPWLRYLCDPNVSKADLEKWAKGPFSFDTIRKSFNGLLEVVQTDEAKQKLLDALDVIRAHEYRAKIDNEKLPKIENKPMSQQLVIVKKDGP